MLNVAWSQTGFVVGDVSLGIVATVCAAWGYVEIAMHRRDEGKRWVLYSALLARWMVALGWTIIATRIWYALAVFGDAPVAAASVLALSLVGSGWITLNLVRAR